MVPCCRAVLRFIRSCDSWAVHIDDHICKNVDLLAVNIELALGIAFLRELPRCNIFQFAEWVEEECYSGFETVRP